MKTTVRTIVATTLLWSPFSLFAAEFTDEHCELARQLLSATEAEESYVTGLKEGLDLQIQSVPQMHSFKSVISQWQDTYLSWDVFEERYIEIICEAYAEDEIRSLLEFYDTPIGKKQLEKSDDIVIEVMKYSELVAARHQPELNIMISKRAKELELEVENLFPEVKAEDEPEEVVIHTATEFQGRGMQELVYTLPRSEIRDKSGVDVKAQGVGLSPIEAMEIAFKEHYSEIGVDGKEYWEATSATLSSFALDSEDVDSPEPRYLWYYSISCSVFGSYPSFGTPPDTVVLLDGELIKPKKKT